MPLVTKREERYCFRGDAGWEVYVGNEVVATVDTETLADDLVAAITGRLEYDHLTADQRAKIARVAAENAIEDVLERPASTARRLVERLSVAEQLEVVAGDGEYRGLLPFDPETGEDWEDDAEGPGQ